MSRRRESEAQLWVHGHIHYCCDYTLGKTRVLANPRGYPTEPTGFRSWVDRGGVISWERKLEDKNALDVKQSASAAQFNRQSDRYGKSHILADTQDVAQGISRVDCTR